MKKVKLSDLGRGVHFFLENFQEGKRIEFMILRHCPDLSGVQSPDGYTFVEAAEDQFSGSFDKTGCNDWRGSSLRAALNGGYLTKLLEDFPELEDAAVTFRRDLTADDGLKDYGTCVDTVSLLTADEYRANRDLYMDDPGHRRWSITPDSTPSGGGSSLVRSVIMDGTLSSYYAHNSHKGVRPALYLRSDLLVSVEGVDEDKAEKDGRIVVMQPNAPLTLEELREMDGEPVWIIPMRGSGGFGTWMLVDAEYELCREAHGEMAVFENCGKTWLAYRRRPEEGEKC